MMLLQATKTWMTYLTVVALGLVVVQIGGSATAKDGSGARFSNASPNLSRSSISDKAESEATRRLREGTIISDQTGFFREDGDGATFVADTGLEFGALPNLNLERVVRLLKSAEEPSSIRWSVAGEVTEFSGRNFLLVSRAVYKSAAPPPVPDRVGQPDRVQQ